jgi:Fe-S cluster biosynthesis and repair protein YggX
VTDIDTRIAQFQNMTAADPDNEMAHFSLGNAYVETGLFTEAVESFNRVIALNPGMSKAYQLSGLALIECGRKDEAILMLEKGYELAASRGDVLVKNIIVEQLKAIGREAPELSKDAEAAAEKSRESGSFICTRTGNPGTQLTDSPFRGAVGEWIQQNISAETWREWIGQGTKVINEMRLDFSRDEDQAVYDQHMREFLGIDDALYEKLSGAAAQKS